MAKTTSPKGDYAWANSEDKGVVKAERVSWVPKEGRFVPCRGGGTSTHRPPIGKMVGVSLVAIEHDNRRFRAVRPTDHAGPGLLTDSVLNGRINPN